MAFFEVDQLSLSFGGVRAVRDVSFEVAQGEVFAIIGPNGAGKTSVFNLITRVFDASAGSVRLLGREITGVARHDVVRHGIARTFQNIELFEGATVLDNLMLGRHCAPHGSLLAQLFDLPVVRRAETATREVVEDVIALLDLAPHRMSLVAGLPYGIRKIVELGRALVAGPKLLLLDEPASGLNPEETHELAHWIRDISDALGITVVMVEHDMSLVSAVADRVLVMEQGQVLTSGTPAEVQSDPRVIAAYLGA
ncbi:ABC transporter ATP-binding protein [Variovorax ginsengisoli]|uniref:ABC transporter ATP-binding protein n=1 Tax=Variovorax ginsengisoli TaxID=363844 RepID=A0ABT8SCY7_9BURK|nr:ABC transporter ATP-binding protein [Variovorax ginsengisoli]MDN8616887.1 ABC transporter ATP-binding protein [Variovorax ginsengisoli]MDO1536057.1 ABC transporter ATP-binding protein [Variovorax ginsengisoli]